MREIKFRGKCLSGKWVYGDLVHFTNTEGVDSSVIITGHQATAESNDFDYALCYARNEFKIVIPASVGQFTGLHDKCGAEIYEGHIVRFDNHLQGVSKVLYEGGQYTVESKNYSTALTYRIAKHIVIIGNIHDNPELLKTE